MYIVSEQDAGVCIAQDNRVMHDEEDHAVLADKVEQRHSRRGKREQDARDAEQRKRHDEQNLPERSHETVNPHLVLAVQIDVGKHESDAKNYAYDECPMP